MLFNYSNQYMYTHFEKEMHKNFRQSQFFSMTFLTLRKDAVKRLSPPQVATCLANYFILLFFIFKLVH